MRCLSIVSVLFVLSFDIAVSRTIFVPNSHATIQAAVDAAADYDTVLVAPGTYRGAGNRDIRFYANGVLLKAQSELGNVTIDCEGTATEPHRAFYFPEGGGSGALIAGFTMCNGYADTGGVAYGLRTSVAFQDCVFSNNRAVCGGAVGGSQFPVTISRCQFEANRAEYGGAVWRITSGIESCRFIADTAAWGGAIYGYDLEIDNCWFEANVATGGGQAVCGGGNVIFGSVFVRHQSNFVIAIEWGAGSTLRHCTFFDNHGVVAVPWMGVIVLEDCLLAFNRGYPVDCETFYDQGVRYDGEARASRSLVYGNFFDFYGCLADYYGINGNLSVDPLFCDTASLDLHVAGNSPCLGNGVGGSDIGAYGSGCGATDVVDGEQFGVPLTYRLYPNHPNPFNPSTKIDFDLPRAGHVTIEILNVLGQCVKLLVNDEMSAGSYHANWSGQDESGGSVASGVYFYRIRSGEFVDSRKMLLLK